MTRRSPARLQGARGFTLVELLVSVLLAAVVLMSIYFVFINNARQYYLQEQVVQMQESVRFAVEFVKNDLRNAGRNTIISGDPNSWNNPEANLFCRPEEGISAVRLFDDDANAPGFLNEDEPFNPDRLRLLRDASSGNPLKTQSINGNQVVVAAADQQSTITGRAIMNSAARFESMFVPGRYLLIHTLQANPPMIDLVPITAVQFNGAGLPATITLANNDALSTGPCIQDVLCTGDCTVNPIEVVEYALQADPDLPRKSDLVRRELTVQGGDLAVRDGSTLVIADYVVNLQFWGHYDTRAPGSLTPSFPADDDLTDDVGNWLEDEEEAMNLRTHRLRGIHMLLAARTPREDNQFTLGIANQKMADRNWFNVQVGGGAQDTLARVATLSSVVETPNIVKSYSWGAP
ncbi:MAG: PilW family protein [Bradymonadia bacterium]